VSIDFSGLDDLASIIEALLAGKSFGESFGVDVPNVSRPSTKNRGGRPLGPKTIAIRDTVTALTAEYDVMTVRQIFYALVSRGVIPKTENGGHRPVQEQVLRMRKDGLLPWSFIAYGTRWQRKHESWESLDDALADMQRHYRRNLWQGQRVRLEVWLEKVALAAIVQQATASWDVPLMVSRGEHGIRTVVVALYDYDAAGRRAARAVEEGLAEHAPGVPITFELLGVEEYQINLWNLPTRPAKATDPEAHKWGDGAVEFDTIPPDELFALVTDAITARIDEDAWKMQQLVEADEREHLGPLVGAA
jgi:hypothetical protein